MSSIYSNGQGKEITYRPLLDEKSIDSLAVFRALQLGDMLCAIPALRALRTKLPHTRITLISLPWAAQFAARFSHYIDDFYAFPGHAALPEQAVQEDLVLSFYETMRRKNFDLAIQLHGNGQISNAIVSEFGAKVIAGSIAGTVDSPDPSHFLRYPEDHAEPIRMLMLTEFLGAHAAGTELEFPLTDQDHEELEQSGLGAGLAPGSYLCIHPGARIREKRWSPRCFAEVADKLAEEFGLNVVLTGSAKEIDLTTAVANCMRHSAINAAGPISIGAMAALMSKSCLLICNDTGVSHIAAGLKLASVVVFSKADINRWSPVNRYLHRCLYDSEGQYVAEVIQHARELLRYS